MELKKCVCVTTELVALSILIAGNAASQTTNARRGSEVEEVVVYGIRQSMESSIAQKRANTSQIDVITAEDVTRFPDVNVAESLSRLPGVTVDRRYAEGEKISILGVDSRLISTTIDGPTGALPLGWSKYGTRL
jgi:iron complex outermembrane receptor protein